MKAIKYNKELKHFTENLKLANEIEVIGIPLVVYSYQELVDDVRMAMIEYVTPDFKVSIFKWGLPLGLVLTEDLLSTKEEYDEFVVAKAEKEILPLFEANGTEKMKELIDDAIRSHDAMDEAFELIDKYDKYVEEKGDGNVT